MKLEKGMKIYLIVSVLFLVYAIGFAIYFKSQSDEIPMWFLSSLLLAPLLVFFRGIWSFIKQWNQPRS